MHKITVRLTNILGFFFCAISLSFAYFFLQKHLGLEPCILCILDRIVIATIGLIWLAAFAHNPKRWGQYIYQSLALLFSGLGIALCWRHIWLQNLPEDINAECSPGLSYMVETLPFETVWQKVFNTKSSCSDIEWTFAGLSIPEQTLLVYIALTSLCLFQIYKHKKQSTAQ
jgi:disulfide bond formation protein DsbB